VLTIGMLILGSDLHHDMLPDAGPDFPGALDPDELATVLATSSLATTTPNAWPGPTCSSRRSRP
jgi:hypothetical protein